ncbi:MAG: S9 family peptidase [Crocinitomicaceae bacterium]|nr:S9 family peptidase [Crocinitomicaceae bacterium]
MKKPFHSPLYHKVSVFVLAVALGACNTNDSSMETRQSLNYPESRVQPVVDTLWNTEVADPYRWLEDDRSEETETWVDAQIEFTNKYLDSNPWRKPLRDRFESIYNYEKVGMPRKIGDRYFLAKNDGLQNQSIWYVRETLSGADKLFLDPNALSEDGTITATLGSASKDNRHIAIVQNEAGSDWQEIHVYDLASGKPQGDVLKWVKFSGTSWVGNGFYYSRYPAPEGSEFSAENTFHSVYYHKIGTDQSEDRLIFRNDDEPNRYHFAYATEDQKFLILSTSTGTDGNSIHFLNLQKPNAQWQELIGGFNTRNSVVDHVNGRFLVLTDTDAPKYRLAGISSKTPSDWINIIPESEHLLESVNATGGQLFATYLRNACNAVIRMDLDGQNPREVKLPNAAGSTGGFGGKADAAETFYAFTSFTYPTSIYRYDIASGESTLFVSPKVDFNPEQFESRQVWFESKDGTEVPMFVVHKKGLKMDGERPTYLYAYGGFNISLTPSFSPSLLLLLENDGVYAMPNLRGGGEFGEDWHEAGMLLKKQNVFDDFIAAGEYLISAGYTNSKRLAMAGGSNGGLLVGATMTQRPELAAVAFPAVGVMDMLRYHQFTIGWGWIPEYGCADSSKADFQNLAGYSPYHNIAPGIEYPATMVTTADHDDRVVPAHSFKFAARLQACQSGSRPALIRIEKNAGHGAGKPTSKILDEQSEKWAFMFQEMGLKPRVTSNK